MTEQQLPEKGASLEEQATLESERSVKMSPGRYLATRFTTLKPPMHHAPNPFKLLALLNRKQWSFFAVAFFAWTWDSFDFFTVGMTVEDLAEDFG